MNGSQALDQSNGAETSQREPSGGLPAAQLQAAIRIARLFGAGSAPFSVALVTLGTTFGMFSVAARLDDPKTWNFSEFIATLGFGALLIILGFIEERLVVRPANRGKNFSGNSGNNGQGPSAGPSAAGESPSQNG